MFELPCFVVRKIRHKTGYVVTFLLLLSFLTAVPAITLYAQADTIIYLEWEPGVDPLRSITINWITDTGGNTPAVEYGTGGFGNSETGSVVAIPDTSKQRNSVTLSGLSPDRTYQFRITSGGITNDTHRFRTLPSSLNNSLKFIVGGDLYRADGGPLDANFNAIASEAASRNPFFAVLGGDLANADASPELLFRWFGLLKAWYVNMETDNGLMIPIIAGMGNHEVPNDYDATPDEAKYFHAFFNFPGYPLAYGALDFSSYLSILMLNTNHTQDVDGAQTSWLDNALDDRTDRLHVFPVYHTPAWPGRDFPDQRHFDIRANWVPVFEDHGLRFVFEHDNHMYKRTYPLIGNSRDTRGIIYMGDGGWGDMLREPRTGLTGPDDPWWFLEETTDSPHFFLVEISDSQRKATAINENGNVIDEVIDYISLPPPELSSPDNITETDFRINWDRVDGAVRYRLDVSDDNFNTYINNFENRNIGDRTNFTVQSVPTNKTYQVRLRAEIPKLKTVISDNSEVQSIKLVKVDPNESGITASSTEVLGDGNAISTITVTIRNEVGDELDGVQVDLRQGSGDSDIDAIDETTGSDGVAIFQVSNTTAESVTYSARAGGTTISQKVTVNFTPVAPVVLDVSNIRAKGFQANWEAVSGAGSYYLDVAEDAGFTTFLPGLENLDVGSQLHFEIDDLTPGTMYYYRVRAEAPTGLSENSSVISATTLQADPNQTTLTVSPSVVLADGDDESIITVRVRDQNGTDLEGIIVTLGQGTGSSEISALQEVSDINGEAIFSVSNMKAERVDYVATAGIIDIFNTVTVNFTPVPPVARSADRIGALLFTANWDAVSGATGYRLDVSESTDFSTFVDGFDDREIGEETNFIVTGLASGTDYYYRVRAVALTGTSDHSNIIEIKTLTINSEASTVSSSIGRILANGDQETIVTIKIFDENEIPLEGVPVTLEADRENSTIREIEANSDENGEAILAVSSDEAGVVTFKVFAGGVELEETFEVEFLEVGDEAVIGNNYPNPFQGQTIIPLTVPETMRVRIYIVNSLGVRVMTLKDEEMDAGYYEIPFNVHALASGTYFYQLITKDGSEVKKMSLTR